MELSATEKVTLMGMITYPDLQDREVSAMLDLPNSTYASAKSRLLRMGIVEDSMVPVFPKLGFELLVAVYGDFNPAVTVEERIKNTRKAVEIEPELVLSMGESHRGFSISVARNITRIMRISQYRTKILAEMNLLEIELPREVLFPFQLSRIQRYFNQAPLLAKLLKDDPAISERSDRDGVFSPDRLKAKDTILENDISLRSEEASRVDLSRTQLRILHQIVRYPGLSASKLSSLSVYSRHTLSRVKDSLIDDGYVSRMRVLDLSMLDYRILSLFHIRTDPKRPLSPRESVSPELLQDDAILLVSRPTEIVLLAVYHDYNEFSKGKDTLIHYLKGNGHINVIPNPRNHSISEAIWVKRFTYHDLIREHFSL